MSLLFSSHLRSDRPFDRFVMGVKESSVFAPQWDREKDHLFCTSLTSIRELLGQSEPSVSANGHSFLVDVGFVESGLPNAFANRMGKAHVCGIHTALPIVIHELALFCFAQAEMFPELGDVSDELSPEPNADSPPGLGLLLAQLREGHTDRHVIAPVTAQRMLAAQILAQLMLRFVWYHELAHGVLGHVDYLNNLKPDITSVLDFNELHYDDIGSLNIPIDTRKLQTMEFEADSYALAKCINIQLGNIENIDLIKEVPVELRLRLTLFGIYAMSWLLESMAGVMKRGKLNVTHPAPIRRLQMNHNMVLWELNDLGADVKSLVGQSFKQFRDILEKLGADWQQTDHFDPIEHRKVFEHMRDELAPFRYSSGT